MDDKIVRHTSLLSESTVVKSDTASEIRATHDDNKPVVRNH